MAKGGAPRNDTALLNIEALLQSQSGGPRADFRAVDHENVGVAALLPFASLGAEVVESCIVITGRHLFAHALEASVGEIGRIRLDQRIVIRMLEHDRDVPRPAKVEEFLVIEAAVPRFDRVT